jgi:predicted ester cyclase
MTTLKGIAALEITLDDVIAEGDKVASRWTADLTDAATGIGVMTTGMEIIRVADGQIVEWWWSKDYLRMLKQLGVILPPEPTAVE